ncbi:MAG: hypothetical protein KAX38_06985, partial [Candidatus Krumholzibacteria bacterium]|nr:hypothetical protein [Candidatus Krumholzibacteria bacterium]
MKKVIFYILMFGLTFALCFIVLEYAFARFYYSDVLLISDTTLDPVTGWILKPGTYRAKPANTFRKHRVYINEFGLRNRDITGINTEGIERIIILGDSFTYGKACREENTFPVKLGKILNQDPAGRRY